MTRPLRIQYPQAIYHVMNRGQSRRPIFLQRSDYLHFLEIVEQAWRRWRFELYAYCLMGNHYHLCVRTPEAKLARIMRHINGVYTQWFNKRHGRDGPLFRGRYKAMLIEEDEYLAQVMRYIHLNPIKAKLVIKPEDYEWSSHKAYLRPKPPDWLSTAMMGKHFGGRKAFHHYVLEGNEKAIAAVYSQKRLPVILGSEEFIETVRSRVNPPNQEHVRSDRQFVRPTVQKIATVVADVLKTPISHLFEGGRGRTNRARQIAIWALQEFGDLSYSEIAQHLSLVSPRTVGWTCHQVKNRTKNDRQLNNQLKKIEERIGQQRT